MADQQSIIAELYKRRDSLDPEKRAVVDELAKRMSIGATPASAPQPTAQQERPGFFERAYDSTVGGIVNMGKEILNKGGMRVADEMGTAIKKRFQENPRKIGTRDQMMGGALSIPTRAVDAALGPVVDSVEGDIKAGNYAGAAGTVAGNVAMLGLPAVLRKAGAAKGATAATKAAPVEQATSTLKQGPMAKAVDYAAKEGIPVTRGEATGSKLAQKMERMAEVTPGASDIATNFYAKRNQQVQAKGAQFVDRLGGGASDTTAAGEAVLNRIKGRSDDISEFADKRYSAVYDAVERDANAAQSAQDATYQKQVSAIEKSNKLEREYWQTRKQLLYESGGNPDLIAEAKQVPIPKPPAKVIPAAVDMGPIKSKLRPLFDELDRNYTTTQKESSPGYARLKAIMNDKDAVRSAIDVDRDLSEIKGVLRRESQGYAETKSGRYASASIDELEKGLQSAIEKAGGAKAVDSLYKGRKAIQEKHRTLEALEEVLPKDASPVTAFERLTNKGDRSILKLLEIKKRAPGAIREIGATYLEGALSKFTGEAGEADMLTASNAWKRLGPRTKLELYGEAAKDLDSFFENAPQLVRNINKSGSGYASTAGKALGSGGLVIGTLLQGGIAGASLGLVGAGAAAGSANAIAKFLFKPGNARLVENTLRYADKPKIQSVYLKRLSAAVEKEPELLGSLQTARIATQGEQASQAK